MAFGATTFLATPDVVSPWVGDEWKSINVDCTDSTIAAAAPRQLLAIPDGMGIEVLGLHTITAGTATATVDLGVYNASATEVDLDRFVDGADTAADIFTPSIAAQRFYVNTTGASTYLCLTNAVTDDDAGEYDVYYRLFPVQVAS